MIEDDLGVRCWGDDSRGEVGVGGPADVLTPTSVPIVSGVTGVAAGYQASCALGVDGTIWCWGLNTDGQLGDGTIDNHTSPVPIALPR